MADEIRVHSLSIDELDELLKDYSQRNILRENTRDLYRSQPNNSAEDDFDCSFKGSCNAFKFNTGNCPCELRR